jgi:hypothetical protein
MNGIYCLTLYLLVNSYMDYVIQTIRLLLIILLNICPTSRQTFNFTPIVQGGHNIEVRGSGRGLFSGGAGGCHSDYIGGSGYKVIPNHRPNVLRQSWHVSKIVTKGRRQNSARLAVAEPKNRTEQKIFFGIRLFVSYLKRLVFSFNL